MLYLVQSLRHAICLSKTPWLWVQKVGRHKALARHMKHGLCLPQMLKGVGLCLVGQACK